MKSFFLIFIVTTASQAFADVPCKEVDGSFKVWNGWPPALRIYDEVNNAYYGIPDESDSVPFELITRIQNGDSVVGKYCLSFTGDETNAPYQDEPIIYAELVRYELL